MAVNESKRFNGPGSRYIPDRLVGPGVITQNSYIDVVKASLHIDGMTPVPTEIIPNVLFDSATVTGSPVMAPAGSLVKLINTTGTALFVAFANTTFTGSVSNTTATTVYLEANSHLFTILPDALTVLKASATGVRAEIIEDN